MQAKSLKPICEVKIYNLSNKKICFCSENGGGNPLLTKEGLGEVIQKLTNRQFRLDNMFQQIPHGNIHDF
jgi:uncharacterized Fe-S cluster-containing radical SAM superfamily protein